MHEIFVNYRTDDGDAAAVIIERYLSDRFGTEHVFHASKSIPAGEDFQKALIKAVRHSRVLLAVIGQRWLIAPDNPLSDPDDWTRREILEAFESGVTVIPVLVGRETPRLAEHHLPPAMAALAASQYRRLDLRDAEAGLTQLGDVICRLIPELIPPAARGDAGGAGAGRGPVPTHTDFYGSVFSGTGQNVVNRPQAPLHMGSGNQYNAPLLTTAPPPTPESDGQ